MESQESVRGEKNSLGRDAEKIAAECKAIRIFYAVLQNGCDFQKEKSRKDIIRSETA